MSAGDGTIQFAGDGTIQFAPPVEDLPLYVNVMLYGPPKTGKTAGATSAAGGILLFNCDVPARTRFARSRKRDPEGRIQEILIEPYSENENQQAVPVMLPLMGKIYRSVMNGEVETVVVDPIGELYRRLLEEQSSRAINLGKNSLQIRLAVTTYIERFCRSLVEAQINAIFVCHEIPVKDEEAETIERLPFTGTSNPNLGQKIMGMVDIIGYTGAAVDEETGEKKYMAQLVPGLGRRGGDGFDCLGDARELNIAEWVERIKVHESEDGPVSTRQRRAARHRSASDEEEAA